MIISHRHRFIFFAVPRTATHAIRAALGPTLGDADWQQQSLTEAVRIPVPALARIGHGHVSFRQVQACLPEAAGDYFKFAVVRNPYDRFVSVCAMLNKRNPTYRGNETDFMKRALGFPRFRARVLVRPQWEMLADDEDELRMDFVGRYETLQQSFDEVCRLIGLPAVSLEPSNASEHGVFPSYYDDELLSRVTDLYREDFKRFGYDTATKAEALRCA